MIKSFKDQSEKITTPEKLTEDLTSEPSLRPQQITEFIGQNEVIENLLVYIQAAREREEALDHVLLFGPPGLGKTTLANLISKELQTNIRMTSGPVIVQVLMGENALLKNREIMGATNPNEAVQGTIRNEFGLNIEANSVHGSDSIVNAKKEISFFFSECEMIYD